MVATRAPPDATDTRGDGSPPTGGASAADGRTDVMPVLDEASLQSTCASLAAAAVRPTPSRMPPMRRMSPPPKGRMGRSESTAP